MNRLYTRAWERQTQPESGKPHAMLQWKGTDACMDIYCKCGHHSHWDGYFAYHITCPKCKITYVCNPFIELTEMTEEEAKDAKENHCVKEPEDDE
jgi:hypothetical protein